MTTKFNPATGLFEDIPEQPLTTIPDPIKPSDTSDPAADNINAKDETVLEHEPPVPDPSHVMGKTTHTLTLKQQLYLDIKNILAEHEGLESNIPVNHVYWKKLNEYRGIR